MTRPGTKKHALFQTLRRRWLTPLRAAEDIGIFSLSQRCTEWERSPDFAAAGFVMHKRWVLTLSGSRVLAYRIGRATHWTA